MGSQRKEKKGSRNTHENVAAFHQILHIKASTLLFVDTIMPDRGHVNTPLHPFGLFISLNKATCTSLAGDGLVTPKQLL